MVIGQSYLVLAVHFVVVVVVVVVVAVLCGCIHRESQCGIIEHSHWGLWPLHVRSCDPTRSLPGDNCHCR